MKQTHFTRSNIWLAFFQASLLTSAIFHPSSDAANSTYQPLEEVIVTARRTKESLQDIPVAVSAFDAEALINQQVSSLGDLKSQVPNLELHVGDAANAVIYIRGVGQLDSISFNDPGVGVYLDDVYLGRAQGSFLDVVDPQQIEVLRGPQGTLYGRNTIGGAVRFTSARPSATPHAYLDVSAGNYGQRDIKASMGGSLIADTLMGRLTVASLQRDGYAKNQQGGEDYDRDTQAWRAGLLFQPNDQLSVFWSADGSRNTPNHSRTPHRETPIYLIEPGDDPFRVNVTYNDLDDLESAGTALTVEYQMEAITLKSISAYRTMEGY